MSDFKVYVVRFATDRFFKARTSDGKAALGSPYMSFARQMTYLTATEVAQSLHELGYVDAVVCDRRGQPVSLESIQNPPAREDISEFIDVWEAELPKESYEQ
jgi:hypothetical protein